MRKRIFFLVPAALLTMSANVLATDSTGRYFEFVTSEAETVLADGRTVVIFNAKQQAVSDKANDPFNNVSGDCTGRMVLSSKGEVMSGSGMCFIKDVSGDGLNHSWKVEETGTEACPDLCGSWQIVDAYGKFEGTTGGGTWSRTHVFSDGAMGSYTSTFTRK